MNALGLHPLPEKVKAVKYALKLRNVSELKSYMGLLSYYLKFLPNLSTILAPLYELLQASTKWQWTKRQEEAFVTSKRLFTSSQVLVHFILHRKLSCHVDALAYGIVQFWHIEWQMDPKKKQQGLPRRHCQKQKRSTLKSRRKGWLVSLGLRDSMHIFMAIPLH